MNQRIILFILLIFCLAEVKSQNNDTQAGLYNILSGSLIGGVGAMINKKPNEKTGKVFLKGLGQGALGGYMTFESKRLIRDFSDTGNYAYVWPSRLLNSLGNSIILNASSNRKFWERYYLNIGFSHFEYDIKRENSFQVKLLPFSLLSTFYGFSQGEIDFRRSFYTGNLFFESYKNTENYNGKAILNVVILNKGLLDNRSNTIGHELIHTFQYEGFIGFNSYLDKKMNNIKREGDFWTKFNFILYPDWNALIFSSAYNISAPFANSYENRFYEKEAYYYTGSLLNE
ncbi:hypothetical protein [Maribacter aquivivus]|nr:hypothetical protein [Maribacter aquivivus]